MEITFTRLDDINARFTLSGATSAFANAFRRAMMADVPSLAIEDVRIYDNNSALFDEMLAHRLGLIPLRTDLNSYVPRDQCSCGGIGCSQCTASYTLSIEGPRTVYSGDLIPGDPLTTPVYDNIPVVKLVEDQKIVLEAHAVISTGTDHAKFSPVIVCGYKNYPIITIDNRCDACGMCVEECPRDVLAPGKKTVEVIHDRLEECSLCRLCERACLEGGIGDEPAVHIDTEDKRFIFVLESDGSLPARTIIECALRHIKGKSDDLVNLLGDIGGIAIEESS